MCLSFPCFSVKEIQFRNTKKFIQSIYKQYFHWIFFHQSFLLSNLNINLQQLTAAESCRISVPCPTNTKTHLYQQIELPYNLVLQGVTSGPFKVTSFLYPVGHDPSVESPEK